MQTLAGVPALSCRAACVLLGWCLSLPAVAACVVRASTALPCPAVRRPALQCTLSEEDATYYHQLKTEQRLAYRSILDKLHIDPDLLGGEWWCCGGGRGGAGLAIQLAAAWMEHAVEGVQSRVQLATNGSVQERQTCMPARSSRAEAHAPAA